jgi:flagellar protein FliO/FliZ
MIRRRLSGLLLCALLACAGAVAEPAAAPAPAVPLAAAPSAPATVAPGRAPQIAAAAPGYAPSPSAGGLMQTIFALTLVLGLLAALAWLMKRYGPQAQAGAGGLRIVGALNLGGRERIMVVEIGDQWIVVGASPGRVSALATLPKQEGAPVLNTQAPPASSFAEWLKQTIDKRNAQ